MYNVLLVIHVMVTIALIAIILVQRNSSDGAALSGSSSTSFMSGRAAASFVTRATSLLAIAFILSSLTLGILTAQNHAANTSILDRVPLNNKPGTDPLAPTPKSAPTLKQPADPAAGATAKPAVPRPE